MNQSLFKFILIGLSAITTACQSTSTPSTTNQTESKPTASPVSDN